MGWGGACEGRRLLVPLPCSCCWIAGQVGVTFAVDGAAPATLALDVAAAVLLEPWPRFVIVGYLMAFVRFVAAAPRGGRSGVRRRAGGDCDRCARWRARSASLGCPATVAGVAVPGAGRQRAQQMARPRARSDGCRRPPRAQRRQATPASSRAHRRSLRSIARACSGSSRCNSGSLRSKSNSGANGRNRWLVAPARKRKCNQRRSR